ncbi:hypothetical protein D3C76_747180 [compost metagenome]
MTVAVVAALYIIKVRMADPLAARWLRNLREGPCIRDFGKSNSVHSGRIMGSAFF